MDPLQVSLPASSLGFRVDELERFLEAADRRVAELEAAIAVAEARRDAAVAAVGSGADARRSIADAWLAAQHEADAIRAAADADVRALLDGAARAVHARPPFSQPT
jgi:cell division septum initiation protein DivIVA